MRVGATIGYFARLAVGAVAGVYVTAYGFEFVVVAAVVAYSLSLLGVNILGSNRVVTLLVFVFSAMVAIHYGWTIPARYYVVLR